MTEFTDSYKELKDNSLLLSKHCPDVAKAFKGLHGEAVKDDVLDKKTKEFIALGIAIGVRCEGCILSHVKTAISLGATMEELAEVVNIAVLMGGGPSTVYGGKALAIAESLFE
ncbi:carboxymuconolactone decarboxylase family protein [Vagococcus sp. PNs007]|uniref:Carboxymuconolactone decarboxylase family protein n=1 Tax=Vagococcus proximus TaxID=2991417 RepID=A0ABT5X4C1_9ENTE|nr:carboxymuconolactone decarboxylase family protein [Vagococcus proximus]MDF0480846.1 carboxymuconolactone decarboxylase family protein [Vagococcus proximus]